MNLVFCYYCLHYVQREIRKNKEKNVERMYEAHWNRLLALDEGIKKLWTIADSGKSDDKNKIKAISLIIQYQKERFELIKAEPDLTQQKKIHSHDGASSCWLLTDFLTN